MPPPRQRHSKTPNKQGPPIQKLGEWLTLLEQLTRIASYISIPIVLAIGGWAIQKAISNESIRKDYVQLVVGILTAPKDTVNPYLRSWAVDLIDSNSPVKLSAEAVYELKFGDVTFPPIGANAGVNTEFKNCLQVPTVSFQPVTATVGQIVNITVEEKWDPCFRAARLKFDSGSVFEIASPHFSYSWDTSNESVGEHTIIVEVASQADVIWQNPARLVVTYTLK